MLDVRLWRTKKIYKYKKIKKYEKIIKELIKIGRNLANTELTQEIEKNETKYDHWDPYDLIFDIYIHIYTAVLIIKLRKP